MIYSDSIKLLYIYNLPLDTPRSHTIRIYSHYNHPVYICYINSYTYKNDITFQSILLTTMRLIFLPLRVL